MREEPGPRPNTVALLQLLRFVVVGMVGFGIDAGILLLVIHGLGVGPIAGRFLSFSIAVIFTYGLNRAWAFKNRVGILRGFCLYLGVQALGFACNLAVYSALFLLLPKPWNAPIACLTVASVVALFVNYSGAKLVVFRDISAGEPARIQ